MGKFIHKSKASLLIEVSNHHSPLSIGVRTRAKTLALQRQANAAAGGDGCCYLELRSRRLEKAAFLRNKNKKGKRGVSNCGATSGAAEFRENERSKGETTLCSFPGDPDTISTPSSTNRRPGSTKENEAVQNSKQQHIPTTHEMNEFFSGPEIAQQKQFIEKYNFDPVNEKPLSGRYEWVKVDP